MDKSLNITKIINNEELKGEFESMVSHLNEHEKRKNNHLTPAALKNFGILLAKGNDSQIIENKHMIHSKNASSYSGDSEITNICRKLE